jgi:hypothetical protein
MHALEHIQIAIKLSQQFYSPKQGKSSIISGSSYISYITYRLISLSKEKVDDIYVVYELLEITLSR